MSRLPHIDIEDLAPKGRELLDKIQQGPRGKNRNIGMIGPFGIWVRSPKIGEVVQNVGAVARYETDLPEDVKEVAICTVGAHFRAKFEFAAHRSLALTAGVSEDILDTIQAEETPLFSDDRQRLAHALAHQLLTARRILPETYAEAYTLLGESPLIELVSIIGYYCLVSVTLNAFEVELLPTMEDPWPDLP